MRFARDAINLGGVTPLTVDIKKHNVIKDLLDSQNKFPEPCIHATDIKKKVL